MDFIDKISAISKKIPQQREHIQTEEATKTAFVMPFIDALGYNLFNPMEVVPEFVADVGKKRGEKVDYALIRDGLRLFRLRDWHPIKGAVCGDVAAADPTGFHLYSAQLCLDPRKPIRFCAQRADDRRGRSTSRRPFRSGRVRSGT